MDEEEPSMFDHFVALDLIDPSPFAWLCPPDEANIERIRADLEDGGMIMAPLHAFKKEDGRWELLTGHDRLEAAKRTGGFGNIPVEWVTSPPKTDEEKVSYVIRDNTLRKSVSPRPAVEWYLNEHSDWSNRRIARLCGCDEKTVRSVRTSLEASGDLEVVFTRTDTLGREQPAKKQRTMSSGDLVLQVVDSLGLDVDDPTDGPADVIPIFGAQAGQRVSAMSPSEARGAQAADSEPPKTRAVGRAEEPPPKLSKKRIAKNESAERRRKRGLEYLVNYLTGMTSVDLDLPNLTDEERRWAGSELKSSIRRLRNLRNRIMAGLEEDTDELEG